MGGINLDRILMTIGNPNLGEKIHQSISKKSKNKPK
jgi:hypothetical protein